ncbi:RidA family protein [Streptomyces mirabilis]|uniref:RidA family protein n=1 Tax=Streptomyces mirabilis TaxID=68239 RepID=UPI0031B9C983
MQRPGTGCAERTLCPGKRFAPATRLHRGHRRQWLFLHRGNGTSRPHHRRGRGENVTEQTRQVLRNLRALLATRGLDFSDVVKVMTHLADLSRDYEAYDAVYEQVFPQPFPVRTTHVGPQARRDRPGGRSPARVRAHLRLRHSLALGRASVCRAPGSRSRHGLRPRRGSDRQWAMAASIHSQALLTASAPSARPGRPLQARASDGNGAIARTVDPGALDENGRDRVQDIAAIGQRDSVVR